MNKNQKGFGLVEGLLIFVILGIVGGTGWYVWKSSKTIDSSLNSSADNSSVVVDKEKKEELTTAIDETETWKSFSPDSGFYTIKLPDGWKFMHQNDDCDCLYSSSMTYKKGEPAVIEKTEGGRDGVYGFFAVVDETYNEKGRFNSNYKRQGEIKAGDLVGNKYYLEYTDEQDGIGPESGSKTYSYYFKKDKKGIYLSYTVTPGEENQLELVEKSIKTLQ